jgi:hypothetical protein
MNSRYVLSRMYIVVSLSSLPEEETTEKTHISDLQFVGDEGAGLCDVDDGDWSAVGCKRIVQDGQSSLEQWGGSRLTGRFNINARLIGIFGIGMWWMITTICGMVCLPLRTVGKPHGGRLVCSRSSSSSSR